MRIFLKINKRGVDFKISFERTKKEIKKVVDVDNVSKIHEAGIDTDYYLQETLNSKTESEFENWLYLGDIYIKDFSSTIEFCKNKIIPNLIELEKYRFIKYVNSYIESKQIQ